MAATCFEFSGRHQCRAVFFDGFPEFFDAVMVQGTECNDWWLPVWASRAQHAERIFPLGGGYRRCAWVDVSLVDDHQVGDFHNTLFNGLQIIARVG